MAVAVAACPVQVVHDSLKGRATTLLVAQGEVIAVVQQNVSVECSADQLRLVGGAKWPAPMSFKVQTPLRLELEVPQPGADAAGWFLWFFEADRMDRNEATVIFPPSFAPAKAAAEKRWADAQKEKTAKPFALGAPTKIGLVDEAAPDDSIYWSGNTLCIGQGDSGGKQVRCYTPTTAKWSARVAKTSKPDSASNAGLSFTGACTLRNETGSWTFEELGMPLDSLPDQEVQASRDDAKSFEEECSKCPGRWCTNELECREREMEQRTTSFSCPTTLRRSPDGKFIAFTASVERKTVTCWANGARCDENVEKLRRVLFLAPVQAR